LARRPMRFSVILGVFLISILIGGAAGMVAGYLRSAPTLDQVVFDQELTTYIYDIQGRVIARLYRENRIPVRLEQMPRHLRDAIIAIEDSRFYEHFGVDLRAILRAWSPTSAASSGDTATCRGAAPSPSSWRKTPS